MNPEQNKINFNNLCEKNRRTDVDGCWFWMYEHTSRRFTTKTLFINKPVAVGYNIVKNSFYDSLKLENMD